MKARYVALSRTGGREDAFDFLNVGEVHTSDVFTTIDHDHDHDGEHDHHSVWGEDGGSALFVAGTNGGGWDDDGLSPEPDQLTQGLATGAPDYAIDALTSGRSWNTTTINYAFMETTPAYAPFPGFNEFSASQRDGIERIVEMLEQYTLLTFQQTDVAHAHIALGNADFGPGAGGYAWYPSGDAQNSLEGDVFINTYYSSQLKANPGRFGFMSLMHEFGHALGLKHPHEGVSLPAGEDTRQFTVESYNYHDEMGRIEPQSFMTYDIAALQDIYGANLGWATGDDVYDYSRARNQIETIWDAGGTDTITAAGSGAGAVIDLNAGAFSSIGQRGRKLAADNIGISYGTQIENAEGSAYADRLVGNAADNRLSGLAGDDIMVGGGGRDAFVFGAGSGADIVEDFQIGLDRLVMTGSELSFGALDIAAEAAGTRVAFGADSVLLQGVSMHDLDAGDFLFA